MEVGCPSIFVFLSVGEGEELSFKMFYHLGDREMGESQDIVFQRGPVRVIIGRGQFGFVCQFVCIEGFPSLKQRLSLFFLSPSRGIQHLSGDC